MRRLFVLLPVLGAFTLGACGDDDSGGTLPLDQMEQTYQHALCETLIRCQVESFFASFDGDADTCAEFLDILSGSDFNFHYVVDAVNAGNASYDPQLGAQCVSDLRSASCEELLGGGEEPAACQDAVTGLLADNASCTLDEECASGWCDMRNACPGTCASTVADGGSCVDGEHCDSGLLCVDGQCVLDPGPAGNGESCEDRDCAYGLYCDWNLESPVCATRGSAGDACDDDDDECDYGMVCDSTGHCKEATVVGAGESCNPEDGLFCSLADGQACVRDVMNEAFLTCEAFRQLNDSCLDVDQQAHTSAFYTCDPFAGLYCDIDTQNYTGVCQAKKAAGAMCDEDEECQSGWCDDESGLCNAESTGPCGDYGQPE